jgi:hypothetical protein
MKNFEMVSENRIGRHPMPITDYLKKQAERCRYFAQRIVDHDLRGQLLELAEEFDRRADEIIRRQGRGGHSSK